MRRADDPYIYQLTLLLQSEPDLGGIGIHRLGELRQRHHRIEPFGAQQDESKPWSNHVIFLSPIGLMQFNKELPKNGMAGERLRPPAIPFFGIFSFNFVTPIQLAFDCAA